MKREMIDDGVSFVYCCDNPEPTGAVIPQHRSLLVTMTDVRGVSVVSAHPRLQLTTTTSAVKSVISLGIYVDLCEKRP